jgi:hypothetical protein
MTQVPATRRRRNRGGFTILELTCASLMMATVTAGTMSFMIFFLRGWQSTELIMFASDDASKALQRMVHCSGGQAGLMSAGWKTTQVKHQRGDWRIDYGDGQLLMYDAKAGEIINESGAVLCDNVVTSSVALGPFGVQLALTVESEARGRRHTSSMSTYVDFRN